MSPLGGFPSSPGSAGIPPQPPSAYQGPTPPVLPPASGGLGGVGGLVQGFGNGIAGAINNHPLTLMALGAGIAQGGVGRGLDLASAAAQAERNLQAQQVNHSHVLNALTGAGVPPDEALAAVMNPSLMRVLAVKYLGPRASANAAGAAPAPGSAASYPPNGANVASSNTPTAWPTLGRAAGTMNMSAVPTGVPTGSFDTYGRPLSESGWPGAPALRADAVPQTGTPAVPQPGMPAVRQPGMPAVPPPGTPQNPVTLPNPFNFGNANLPNIQIWNKLFKDPLPLQWNPFFRHEPDYENPPPGMLIHEPIGPPNLTAPVPFDPRRVKTETIRVPPPGTLTPMNPLGGSPILPPEFRK